MTVLSKAEILESWPQPAPKTNSEPNFAFLKELRNYLKSACYEIPSEYGGGAHGHLFLVVSPAIWTTITGSAFNPPAQPPANPVIPPGATGPQIANLQQQHTTLKECFATYQNVMAAARQILVQSINPVYLRAIRNANTFYGHLSPNDLLAFLADRYGQLLPHEIEKVEADMKKPWSPNDPFEIIIEQIEDAVDTMDSIGQPFSPAQILNNAYLLVHKTGLYLQECKDWRNRPAADKTWNNFKDHFLAAYKQLRADQTTNAAQLQYGQANLIQDTMLALQQMMEQKENNNFNLQQVNAALSKDNSTLKEQLDKQARLLADLTNMVKDIKCQNTNAPRRRTLSGNYCYTHGFLVGKDHNSSTCKKPGPDHKKEATATNRMGGSTRGMLVAST